MSRKYGGRGGGTMGKPSTDKGWGRPDVAVAPACIPSPVAPLSTAPSCLSPSSAVGWQKGPVEGLYFFPNFITMDEESKLGKQIDGSPWVIDIQRRTQHYGYQFNYHTDQLIPLGPMPPPILEITQRITAAVKLAVRRLPAEFAFDQMIVNEYPKDLGIRPHIDREHCFGEAVAALSLFGDCVMDFTPVPALLGHEESKAVQMHVPQRSLYVMSGEVRHQWQHGIAEGPQVWHGRRVNQTRRVSLTVRQHKDPEQPSTTTTATTATTTATTSTTTTTATVTTTTATGSTNTTTSNKRRNKPKRPQ